MFRQSFLRILYSIVRIKNTNQFAKEVFLADNRQTKKHIGTINRNRIMMHEYFLTIKCNLVYFS